MFTTLDGCLSSGAAADVELLSAAAVSLTGADHVDFRAAWPSAAEPIRTGGGAARSLPAAFGAVPGSSGPVRECGDGSASTGLVLAVVLPVPTDTAVIVDGIEVEYRTGGEDHVTVVDAVLGTCAANPARAEDEHEYCRE